MSRTGAQRAVKFRSFGINLSGVAAIYRHGRCDSGGRYDQEPRVPSEHPRCASRHAEGGRAE